ncbi:MAG: hypothetical protein AB7I41_24435 [Candidatus Sericytochromatia bacterium]
MPVSSVRANSNNHCQRCLLPAGVHLLDDFYPVGPQVLPDSSRLKQIELNPEGLCEYCARYLQNYDSNWLEQELVGFFAALKASSKPLLLALSGGKDSLSCLFLLREILGVSAQAFTYDNGFLPSSVLAQTARICEDLNTPWEVIRSPLLESFQAEYIPDPQGRLQAQTGLDFCQICAGQVKQTLMQICERDGLNYVAFGNKTYTRLNPKVSCLKTLPTLQGGQLRMIHLLFALRTSTTQQTEILAALNWQDPGLSGYTSNCLVPGLVAAARKRKTGFASDAGYIEMEYRSGAYTAEELRQILAAHSEPEDLPLPPELSWQTGP